MHTSGTAHPAAGGVPMTITPLDCGFGAEVAGVDLARLSAAAADRLRAAMREHTLLIFRQQVRGLQTAQVAPAAVLCTPPCLLPAGAARLQAPPCDRSATVSDRRIWRPSAVL